jgi:hypothetical protein
MGAVIFVSELGTAKEGIYLASDKLVGDLVNFCSGIHKPLVWVFPNTKHAVPTFRW